MGLPSVPAELDIEYWGAVNGVQPFNNEGHPLNAHQTNVLNPDFGEPVRRTRRKHPHFFTVQPPLEPGADRSPLMQIIDNGKVAFLHQPVHETLLCGKQLDPGYTAFSPGPKVRIVPLKLVPNISYGIDLNRHYIAIETLATDWPAVHHKDIRFAPRGSTLGTNHIRRTLHVTILREVKAKRLPPDYPPNEPVDVLKGVWLSNLQWFYSLVLFKVDDASPCSRASKHRKQPVCK
jgi:hypothetical protein